MSGSETAAKGDSSSGTSDSTKKVASKKVGLGAKNWDKIVQEFEEEEKKEADKKSVDQLFQEIYAQSDENTRRAMMKSFVESAGTCLSTNWEEVSKKKVEVTPPDGMEYKKWN